MILNKKKMTSKELMNFLKSLDDRGLLSKSLEDFDYEWLIYDYLKKRADASRPLRKGSKINL
jgi:hypothetical protein